MGSCLRLTKVGAVALFCAGAAHAIDEFSLDSDDVVAGKLSRANYAGPQQGLGCSGENISPHLSWFGPPPGTAGFALTIENLNADAGAPRIHWILVNIPAQVTEIPRGAGNDTAKLPAGVLAKRNDFGVPGYVGLCPPPGKRNNYHFRLTAVSVEKLQVGMEMTPSGIDQIIQSVSLGSAAFVVNQGR
jgi:hypothetical protein